MAVIRVITLLTGLSVFVIACVVPYFILYFFAHQVRILKRDWRPILGKSIFSFIVWLALSFIMLCVIFFGFIYGDRFEPPEAGEEVKAMLILLGFTIVYGLLGLGLCYFVKGRAMDDIEEENNIVGLSQIS